MKLISIFMLAALTCAFAQDVLYQTNGPVTAASSGTFEKFLGGPVQGAPYSATITNQSAQTLADGNRIEQTSTGTIARDSQGRTRQDVIRPFSTYGSVRAKSSATLGESDRNTRSAPSGGSLSAPARRRSPLAWASRTFCRCS